MSSISRWSYANTATVRPRVGLDQFNGGVTWGTPYEIACTWTGQAETVRLQRDGMPILEYQAKNVIYTEDPRPRRGDEITLNAISDAASQPQEIQDVTEWDMSAFGEADSPDFRIIV